MEEKTVIGVKRNYKDTLFRMIFKERETLLSLYNAVSGGNYSDPEKLEKLTSEKSLYSSRIEKKDEKKV